MRFLINPDGVVDGFLLINGMQVKFPPHMASQLTSIIAPTDKVSLIGFQENKMLFEAETVVNQKTFRTLAVIDPIPPDPPPIDHKGLHKLSSHGTVQIQLLGRRGEINGVVLKNGSIVMFGPHLPAELKVQTGIGQHIEASGYGTENSYGQSIDATEMSNF